MQWMTKRENRLVAVNGNSSVTSSPFGIRIALPSFRFHFGKQLRPEIASGKRASVHINTSHSHADSFSELEQPEDSFFFSFTFGFGIKRNETIEWTRNGKQLVNRNWTRCRRMHFECTHSVTHAKSAECVSPATMKQWWRRVNIWINISHALRRQWKRVQNRNPASSWASIERTPQKTKRSWLLWCVVCHCECDSVYYIRSQSALSVFSPPSSVRTRVHSHGSKKSAAHMMPTECSRFKCGICGTTRSKCMQILVQCSCECVCVRVQKSSRPHSVHVTPKDI